MAGIGKLAGILGKAFSGPKMKTVGKGLKTAGEYAILPFKKAHQLQGFGNPGKLGKAYKIGMGVTGAASLGSIAAGSFVEDEALKNKLMMAGLLGLGGLALGPVGSLIGGVAGFLMTGTEESAPEEVEEVAAEEEVVEEQTEESKAQPEPITTEEWKTLNEAGIYLPMYKSHERQDDKLVVTLQDGSVREVELKKKEETKTNEVSEEMKAIQDAGIYLPMYKSHERQGDKLVVTLQDGSVREVELKKKEETKTNEVSEEMKAIQDAGIYLPMYKSHERQGDKLVVTLQDGSVREVELKKKAETAEEAAASEQKEETPEPKTIEEKVEAQDKKIKELEARVAELEGKAPAAQKPNAGDLFGGEINGISNKTLKVSIKGDCLWKIAKRELEAANPGKRITNAQILKQVKEFGRLNPEIYGENPSLKDLDKLYIGQELKLCA